MTQSPLVSVVINNYNYQRYVGEAIESALRQDYHPVEVVVVDDGSTDGSVDVIQKYDDHIVMILQQNNGQGSAYNAGFVGCRGEFVIFLDADDRIKSNAVSTIVERFGTGVSKVQFGLDLIDGNGRQLGQSVTGTRLDTAPFRSLLIKFLSYPSPPGSGNAYSRKFLQTRLPLPPAPWRICADAYLILAAPLDGSVTHVHECLGDYRRHGTGASDLTAGNLVAYVTKEYNRLIQARQYIAGLLGTAATGISDSTYGFEPTHLKLVMAEVFLCHGRAPSWSVRLNFIRQAVRTALGWTPWPAAKRWALPVWVLLVCLCPHQVGARVLAASLVRGLPKREANSHRPDFVASHEPT
jgi:hypothetical protein